MARIKKNQKRSVSKVGFYKNGKGYIATRVNIPKSFLELIGVTLEKPYIEIFCNDGKIIVNSKE